MSDHRVATVDGCSGTTRLQFSLYRLFAAMFAVGAWCTLIVFGRIALPLSLPLLLLTAFALGAPRAVLRVLGSLAALGGAIVALCIAVRTYPPIVIADNLGAGGSAWQVSRDAAIFAAIFLAIALLGTGAVGYGRLFWASALLLAGTSLVLRFASDDTPESLRWATEFLLGFLIVLRGRSVRGPSGSDAWLTCSPAFALVLPLVMVLTDCAIRVHRGETAAFVWPISQGGGNTFTGAIVKELADTDDNVVAVSGEGHLRASYRRGILAIETSTGENHATIALADQGEGIVPEIAQFAPDASVLAFADNKRNYTGSRILLVEAPDPHLAVPKQLRLRHQLTAHDHWWFAMQFSQDGQTLFASNGDGTVAVWNVRTGREIATFTPFSSDTHNDVSVRLAATPDGKYLATWAPPVLRVWDMNDLRLVREFRTSGRLPVALEWSPGARTLVASDEQYASLWLVRPGGWPFAVAFLLTCALVASFFWMCWSRRLGVKCEDVAQPGTMVE